MDDSERYYTQEVHRTTDNYIRHYYVVKSIGPTQAQRTWRVAIKNPIGRLEVEKLKIANTIKN